VAFEYIANVRKIKNNDASRGTHTLIAAAASRAHYSRKSSLREAHTLMTLSSCQLLRVIAVAQNIFHALVKMMRGENIIFNKSGAEFFSSDCRSSHVYAYMGCGEGKEEFLGEKEHRESVCATF